MTYCSNCGAAIEDGAKFCASCGEPTNEVSQKETATSQTHQAYAEPSGASAPQEEKKPSALVSAFAGNLFLALCVLVTIATVLAFDLINLLFTIFCWLIYFEAKKDKLNVTMMRAVSGTVFAGRIIYFIGAISLLICAGIIFLCSLIIPPEVTEEISAMYGEIITIFKQEGVPQEAIDIVTKILGYGINKLFAFLAGMLAVLGVYLLALGIIWGGIHKFAKELYTKAETGEAELVNAKKAANCMMVAGVIMAAVAIFEVAVSFSSIVPALLTAATIIVGSVFVKNNFKE